MSTWIRGDVYFGARAKLFSLSRRQACLLGYPLGAWEHPGILAEWIEEVFHKYQYAPGAFVVMVHYDPGTWGFVFEMWHDSFPRIPFAGPLPKAVPLIEEDEEIIDAITGDTLAGQAATQK